MSNEPTWTFQKHSSNVHELTLPTEGRKWEQYILCISDAHWDHPDCQEKLLKEHLQEAVDYNAPILFNGDFFCIMQSMHDKRRDKGKTKPKHDKNAYFNAIIEDAVEWLLPYSNNICLFGYGNHETKVLKHSNFDILRAVVNSLRDKNPDCPAFTGGYSGFVKLSSRKAKANGLLSSIMYYHHGSGGNSPVTKGVIGTARRQDIVQNADLIWTGHVHQEWNVSRPYTKLNRQNRIIQQNVTHFSTPGYKDEYKEGESGWGIEKGFGPSPIGGAWIKLSCKRETLNGMDTEYHKHELFPAK
jgi:UDP-2,3-diacylglucosamine pyrophosphatase LpxH